MTFNQLLILALITLAAPALATDTQTTVSVLHHSHGNQHAWYADPTLLLADGHTTRRIPLYHEYGYRYSGLGKDVNYMQFHGPDSLMFISRIGFIRKGVVDLNPVTGIPNRRYSGYRVSISPDGRYVATTEYGQIESVLVNGAPAYTLPHHPITTGTLQPEYPGEATSGGIPIYPNAELESQGWLILTDLVWTAPNVLEFVSGYVKADSALDAMAKAPEEFTRYAIRVELTEISDTIGPVPSSSSKATTGTIAISTTVTPLDADTDLNKYTLGQQTEPQEISLNYLQALIKSAQTTTSTYHLHD